jgi:SET domain-containing protein
MFLYKTEVRTATNSEMGLGLFAKEHITTNSVVWKYVEGVDIKFHIDRLKEFNDAQKEYFKKYAWIEKSDDGEEYVCSNADLSNFINHSNSPNIISTGSFSVAIRDIQVDEEIFIDYNSFDTEFDSYKDEMI